MDSPGKNTLNPGAPHEADPKAAVLKGPIPDPDKSEMPVRGLDKSRSTTDLHNQGPDNHQTTGEHHEDSPKSATRTDKNSDTVKSNKDNKDKGRSTGTEMKQSTKVDWSIAADTEDDKSTVAGKELSAASQKEYDSGPELD